MKEVRPTGHLRLVSSSETPNTDGQLAPALQPFDAVSYQGLARRLARIELVSIDAAIWRHVSPGEQSRPDSGEGARGTGGGSTLPTAFRSYMAL